jgi:glycosyltransferase involved in cell wall biosynthesis
MTPAFSVVIPTDQRPALLLKCLDALGKQQLPRDQFEIIVVDDGNSIDTETAVQLFAKQIARSGGPLEVRYLRQPERRGPAAARNRGWRAARGRIIAFTDVDCLPHPEWLSEALPSFQRGAQVLMGQLRPLMPEQSFDYEQTMKLQDKEEFNLSNCLCRKSALERVGGFEEIFDIAWRDDNDLRFKLLQAGIPISKCPEAIVTYPVRSYSWRNTMQEERKHSYNALLYKRHPDLFRERVPQYRGQAFQYYTSVVSIFLALLGILLDQKLMAATGFGVWLLLWVDLIIRHLPGKELTKTEIKQAAVTALVTPFLSVYWRLYGAIKYRVPYW